MGLIFIYNETQIRSPSAGQSGCKLLSFNPILREFYCVKAVWDGLMAEEHEASHDCLYQRTVPVSTHSTIKPWSWSYTSRKVLKIHFQPGDQPSQENVCMWNLNRFWLSCSIGSVNLGMKWKHPPCCIHPATERLMLKSHHLVTAASARGIREAISCTARGKP